MFVFFPRLGVGLVFVVVTHPGHAVFQPRFVAGSLGPTGMLISSSDPALSKITFDELASAMRRLACYWFDLVELPRDVGDG